MSDADLDRRIAAAVCQVEASVPEEALAEARRLMLAGDAQPRSSWRRLPIWAALAAGIMLLVIMIPRFRPSAVPDRKISQIRTEFTLADKGIRIIWIQRDDFRLLGNKIDKE